MKPADCGQGDYVVVFALARVAIIIGLGVAFGFPTCRAVAKTPEDCNAEYAAKEAVIKAAGGTKAAFLSSCLSGAETTENCDAKYLANQDVIKASGGTKAAYIEACRAGSTTRRPAQAVDADKARPAPTPMAEAHPPAAPAAATTAELRMSSATPPDSVSSEVPSPPGGPVTSQEPLKEANVAITASSGNPTKIDVFMSVNPTCSSAGYADIQVRTDVQNGKFSEKYGHDRPNFPAENKLRKCNAQLVPSVQLYYQSNRGYTGVDKVSVMATLPTGEKAIISYNIVVK